jgi:hypothetical protein
MLSSLAYTQVQTFLRARAFDAGIEVYEVNPAYTSVIGRYKFSGRDTGVSVRNILFLNVKHKRLFVNEMTGYFLLVISPSTKSRLPVPS